MSRYPGATWRPVTRYQSGSLHVPMTPRRGCVHTAVTNATPSMHDFFNVDGRATPHFYLGRDGELEQYVDTDYRASANLDGNWNIISIETWDGYGASWNGGGAGPRFTDKQAITLAALMVWCAKEHGIPLHALRSSARIGTGWGWHRLGIDGNFPSTFPLYGRKTGCEHWSLSAGKVCPTDTRIKQTVEEILPMARRIAAGRTHPTKPTPAKDTPGHAEVSARELRKAVKAMKPSKRRSKLQAALRLIRGVLSPKSANRRPNEPQRRPHEESNGKPLTPKEK